MCGSSQVLSYLDVCFVGLLLVSDEEEEETKNVTLFVSSYASVYVPVSPMWRGDVSISIYL